MIQEDDPAYLLEDGITEQCISYMDQERYLRA